MEIIAMTDEDYVFKIPKGGKFFVYSDGVPDANNAEDGFKGPV